ncbi:hypothetical protein AGMMS49975_27460 [Clostridia bacterium]|nr:hypothetical protein AGMMS49975_27460 [Clostridia bacterium]
MQVGKTLSIPVLHEGGVSLKEQFALIDKKEAVLPLDSLSNIMQQVKAQSYVKIAPYMSNMT